MREHMGLFRGKRSNGEWAEGSLHIEYGEMTKDGNRAIDYRILGMRGECYYVDPTTIGECTGLKNKNGKLIFEGDMFSIEDEIVAVVIFKDGCFRMEEYGLCGTWTESVFDECGGGWGIIQCDPIDWYTIGDMENIGNITDNPELLKGGEGA